MLEVEDIHFDYGTKKILQGVTFSANEGDIVALIGISGSGKTTLFRLIAGLLTPVKGKIIVSGDAPDNRALQTTYMRQEDLLLPWRTVLGNLLLFTELGNKQIRQPEPFEQAASLLKKVGLEGSENLYPKALSGGMRQRVALARSLMQNCPIMLLDEPFASLDVVMREQLYLLLRDIRNQYKKTIVMVTHDFRDAMALADRILVLSNGKIVATHTLAPTSEERAVQSEQLIQQIRKDLVFSS